MAGVGKAGKTSGRGGAPRSNPSHPALLMSASGGGSTPDGLQGRPHQRVAWAGRRWSSSIRSTSTYGRLLSITPSNTGSAPSVPEREPCLPHEIFGYRTHKFWRTLCNVGYILSCGTLFLIFYWKPAWDVWANCVRCDLQDADIVLLRTTDEHQRCFKKKVVWIDLLKIFGKGEQLIFEAEKDSVLNSAIKRPQLKVRYIEVQKIRYVWDYSARQFHRIGSLEDTTTCYEIHQKYGAGLSMKEQHVRKLVCGPNTISVEIRPVSKLVFKEILNPFYVFQAFTVILWLSQGYYEYSLAILILSIISIGLTVYNLRQQSIKLHQLVEEHNQVQVTILTRNEGNHRQDSSNLVPGDILVLEGQKLSLPCDAILLDGSCVVNEGMLTGESMPVVKTPLPIMDNTMPWKTHSVEDYRRHVLFCGTEVIQMKNSVHGPPRAVVLQTGFNTAKGDLVRAILYPKPLNFRLYRDVYKFILCLALIGILGLVYAVCVYVSHEQPVGNTVAMSLLLMTIAVPPAFPAALTACILYAQRRLKKKKIFCICPQRINICGLINLVCFDKTGTLTEEGLDLYSVTPCVTPCPPSRSHNLHSFSFGRPVPWGPTCKAMATCHSLVVLDGKIQGDPLDVKMFEGTKWIIEDQSLEQSEFGMPDACMVVKPGPSASEAPVKGIKILHQFPFCSALQRMSVIIQELGNVDLELYMKGAPEIVASFCKPSSMPPNFQKGLNVYTSQGFRVIAFAHKTLSDNTDLRFVEREEVESNLTFLGLLIMENRLKRLTIPILEELRAARIRTVMVTGDNLETTIRVAVNSKMISNTSKLILVEAVAPKGPSSASVTWRLIENVQQHYRKSQKGAVTVENPTIPSRPIKDFHFVLDGKSLQVLMKHFSDLLPKILLNGTVFARMSPGQKSTLIEEFQKLDYCVAMCGDGPNDCGALKMAHVGISRSKREDSVASPFTSKIATIQCVPDLIREGRACLISSFVVFKYLILYALIQFIGTALLYWQLQIFGNYQYLVQGICITLCVCLTMSLNQANPQLAPYRPAGLLLSPPLLLSVVLHVCLAVIVLAVAFVVVRLQPWYSELRQHSGCPSKDQPLPPANLTANATAPTHKVLSYETSTLWPLVTIHCIIVAFVFSQGKPFRKPIYTNYIFCILLCLQLCLSLFLFFADFDDVYKVMELLCTPFLWKIYVLLMLVLIFVVAFVLEDFILQNRNFWKRIKDSFNFHSTAQYRKWKRRLEREASWPPVNQTDLAHGHTVHGSINPSYDETEDKN